MKTLNLIITSKNKKSLNDFLFVFYKNSVLLNDTFITKKFQIPTKKKVITILKSPHVNKTAQEQFEIKYLSKQIQIRTTHLNKFLIFIKKLKVYLFPDTHIKIELTHNKKKSNLTNKKIFNLNNYYYKLNFIDKFNKVQLHNKNKNGKILNNSSKTLFKSLNLQIILKLLDTYGKH
jgi:ribosomal protein S10